jgi:hypothetical protein
VSAEGAAIDAHGADESQRRNELRITKQETFPVSRHAGGDMSALDAQMAKQSYESFFKRLGWH